MSVKPGSVNCHKKFTAQVYVLTKDEGGRHTRSSTTIVRSSTSEQLTLQAFASCRLVPRCVMPGDNVEMTIELIHPVAMEQGLRFAIREGGRTVGSGRVATVIE